LSLLDGQIAVESPYWYTEMEKAFSEGRAQGPAWIWNRGSGYLIEYKVPSEILSLGSDLEKTATSTSVGGASEKSDGAELLAIFAAQPMGQGFLAFGDIVEPENPSPPNSAFVYFNRSKELEILKERIKNKDKFELREKKIPVGEAVRDQYTRYYMPYIAAIGETGYILFLDESPYLGKVEQENQSRRRPTSFRRLTSFPAPAEFQYRPRLERDPYLVGRPWEQETEFYEVLQKTNYMAAGLYAWNQSLYLLGRKAENIDGTVASWWLFSIDTESGEEIFRKRLPTDAAHLTVIFGPEFTAFVEKGPVSGITDRHAPYMPILHMSIVPTSWLENRNEGRLHSSNKVSCKSVATGSAFAEN
jgi:hypothetical protein